MSVISSFLYNDTFQTPCDPNQLTRRVSIKQILAEEAKNCLCSDLFENSN